MPAWTIVTNLPRASIPSDFIKEASEAFQKEINKPMQYICVCVMPDQMMSFGGSQDPCALMHVMSIGNLGVEENKRISDALFKFVKEKLKIEGNRAYINFHDMPRADVGFNATTFAK